MIVVLAMTTVLAWGFWIPVAQIIPGVTQSSRALYVSLGNALLAASALAVGGGHISLGWRGFWLPLAGGVVWTGGSYCAFRASEIIGLARASGSWTPLNIIVAFVWGALLFGELDGFSASQFAILGAALLLVLAGIFFIIRSQDAQVGTTSQAEAASRQVGHNLVTGKADGYRRGFLFAGAAGLLWGSYFIPAQWAKVPAQVANFPLALGILVAATLLVTATGRPARLRPRDTAVQLSAGLLFGIGNIALLGLVARVGTGVGFTIAQLSLLVNVSIGILVFKVPQPGSRAARIALVGIFLAGIGGVLIGNVR